MHQRTLGLLAGFALLTPALWGCARPAQAGDAPTKAPARALAVSRTFYNPIKATFNDDGGGVISEESPDPFMTYWNGNYYLTTTRVTSVSLRKARSVAELTNAPETLVWQDSTASRSKDIWAPEFHRLTRPDGQTRWYLYYTADDGNDINHRMYVLESRGDDPLGPYDYKAQLATNTGWAIDGTVYKRSGGGLYFLWSGRPDWNAGTQYLYIASMSDPWTLSSAPTRIAAPQYDWEKVGNAVNEAPEVLERGGTVSVVYSASACSTPDYKLGLLTASASSNLLSASSWSKRNIPIFQSSSAAGVYGPGHNGFFKSPDGTEDWMVYHATAAPVSGCGGPRTTRAQKITWNADNTPNLGTPVGLNTPITLPSGDPGGVENLLSNPSFEADAPTQTPGGWQTWCGNSGSDCDADYTERSGNDGVAYSGERWLTHYKASAYQVYTYQSLSVPNGTYTLKANVVSSGDQPDAFMSAKNYGGAELKAKLVGDNNVHRWREITIANITVTNGSVTVGFYSFANPGNYMRADNVRLFRQ